MRAAIVSRALMFTLCTSSALLAVSPLVGGCGPGDMNVGTNTDAGTSSGSGGTEPTTGIASDCGNDLIEPGEECDGVDLGGLECPNIDPAYTAGTLACGASCTFDASGCMLAPGTPLVVLNEVTSQAVLAGPFMSPRDAIELHNAGTAAADLSGWQLSDDPTLPALKTYVFPNGSSLGPGEYTVLIALDPNSMIGDYPFGVSDNLAETITLADAGGKTVDTVLVDGYRARVSYCRLPDGSGPWEQCEQTFGGTNMLAATACGNGELEAPEKCDEDALGGQTCAGLGLGYSGGALACSPTCAFDTTACTTDSELVINELESTVDDIEIFNGSGAAVDLSGWILTDDKVDQTYDPALDLAELVFPPGTSIAAGAYLVVHVGTGVGQHPFGLGVGGDRVTLTRPDHTIVDQVTYGNNQAVMSYCRTPNGPGGAWTADCAPTMGSPN